MLRFPLAVMVVINHVFNPKGIMIGGNPIDTSGHRSFVLVNHIIEAFNDGYSVPIFFFISGFLFFLGIEFTKETYFYKIEKRIKTLFIPYVIWNTLSITILFCKLLPFLSKFAHVSKTLNFTWTGLLSCFWIYDRSLVIDPMSGIFTDPAANHSYPILVPMWFLRDLMVVVLFSPLIYWVLKQTKHYVLTLLGIAWIVLGYWQLEHISMLLTAFFFFSWGAYMSINGKDLLTLRKFFRLSMVMYPILGIVGVVSIYCFPEWSKVIRNVGIVFGLFLAYDVATWLLQKGVCKLHPFLASASFFIYVSHPFINTYILKFIFILTNPSSSIALVFVYTSAVILTIIVLLVVYYLMRRYCPLLLKAVTGRN